ncbi:hypothetical protein EHI42_26065 [Rhizobium hidalgonense]|nr:hypothetical protein EHI42_26065 [Rhizobium hidalgonense]
MNRSLTLTLCALALTAAVFSTQAQAFTGAAHPDRSFFTPSGSAHLVFTGHGGNGGAGGSNGGHGGNGGNGGNDVSYNEGGHLIGNYIKDGNGIVTGHENGNGFNNGNGNWGDPRGRVCRSRPIDSYVNPTPPILPTLELE